MLTQLSPAQQQAFDHILHLLPTHPVIEIMGDVGAGKTTLLHHAHRQLGGELLQMYDFIDQTRQYHPLAIEEAFETMVMTALQQNPVVIVDDLQVLMQVCHQSNVRPGLLALPIRKLCAYATQHQKTFLVATSFDCFRLRNDYHQTGLVPLKEFQVKDYEFLCQQYLQQELAARLDYDKIYRFASHLSGYQLRRTCMELNQDADLTTERFIEYLKSQQLSSNVDLGEVQPANLDSLKGIDDVLQSLEANLIIPLEQDELAKELDLQPKRGVLLAGPPGTGKTTIGRALAHRLKSKFFLIDGTFIAGTGDFYRKIQYIFEVAKQNAPAIVFIDDTDVIFEEGGDTGLYRYLLTLLDGLESATAGQVCVMMTAMDVRSLPPALVRSGRIELWLEMRLPNTSARTEILQTYLSQISLALRDVDLPQLAIATDGFTGADLKRLIAETKTLYAYDLVQGHSLKSPTDYFLAAVAIVSQNKQRYTEIGDESSPATPQLPEPFHLSQRDRLRRAFLNAVHHRDSNARL